jgi:tungstate transport system substrate-binding protein
MTRRRDALARGTAAAAMLAWPMLAAALQRRSLDDPLRLAADDALVDSGLAGQLQRTFGVDTGVAAKLVRGPASALLEALERGENDVALMNIPEAEVRLEREGLLHDRRLVAATDFVLAGPKALAGALGAGSDAVVALTRLALAKVPFMSRHDGSGTHLAELALLRGTRLATDPDWYLVAPPGGTLLEQARKRQACALVERGVWSVSGVKGGYVELAPGDARLAVDVHVMRSFRSSHPAARLFVNWVSGAMGRKQVLGMRGYRAPGR